MKAAIKEIPRRELKFFNCNRREESAQRHTNNPQITLVLGVVDASADGLCSQLHH